MNGYAFLLDETQTIEIPWWWLNAVMVWAGVVGLVLWLFGRQLVKPMFALVTAGLVALLVSLGVRYFSTEMPLTYWLIGGALVGALAGWLLARLAVAIVFAVVLGIVAPWAVVAAQGVELPAFAEPVAAAIADLREQTAEAIETAEEAEPDDAAQEGEAEGEEAPTRIDPEQLPSLGEAYADLREELSTVWSEWWEERSGSTRWAVVSAAGAALVLGGALALVLPNLAGALMTALLGVLLMLWPACWLVGSLPEGATGWIPRGGWALALVITLGVLLGALIQWTIFRPRGESD